MPRDFLARSSTLWTAFIVTLVLTAVFGIVMHIGDFQIIDEMHDPEKIRAHLADMTAEQRRAHAWLTGTVDVAYPLAYGTLFTGMAMRYFPEAGTVLWLPILLVIPFDLAEGLILVMALNGNDGVIEFKRVVTPIKLILFIFGLITCICATWRAWRQRKAKTG